MTQVESRWYHNHLVYYNPLLGLQSWLDVVGPNAVKCVEDFVSLPVDDTTGFATAYTSTAVNSSTVALGTVAGGSVVLTSDTAENDGVQMQLKGEAFKLDGVYPAYFGARFKVNDADQTDIILGLCITDTTLLGGMTDGVYFRSVDESAALSIVIEKDSTETTGSIHTLVDDTYVTAEFTFDGTYIDSYIDGVLQTRLAVTNLPNDEELTPSIALLTGEAAANTLTVAWMRAFQIRA